MVVIGWEGAEVRWTHKNCLVYVLHSQADKRASSRGAHWTRILCETEKCQFRGPILSRIASGEGRKDWLPTV
jgi:hypothetical protein